MSHHHIQTACFIVAAWVLCCALILMFLKGAHYE